LAASAGWVDVEGDRGRSRSLSDDGQAACASRAQGICQNGARAFILPSRRFLSPDGEALSTNGDTTGNVSCRTHDLVSREGEAVLVCDGPLPAWFLHPSMQEVPLSARNLFVPVLALAFSGCNPAPVELDEDLGTEIVTGLVMGSAIYEDGWTVAEIVWSSDSREIFFLSGDYIGPLASDIAAVDVETATTRVLTSTLGNTGSFQLSHDGEWLYFYDVTVDPDVAVEEDHVYARVAVEGGTPETVMESAPQQRYALSPDGAYLAYGGHGHPVALYDIAQGTTDDLDVNGVPLLYSPDGSELLVFSDYDDLEIVSLDDGTAAHWTSLGGLNADVHWEGNRLELVSYVDVWDEQDEDEPDGFQVLVTDRSGNTRAVTEEGALDYDSAGAGELSPDGTQVAIWFGYCLDDDEPCRQQYVLHLIDIASGSISTIGATQISMPSPMAFSPDGRHLAYVATSGNHPTSVFVKAVP
jgi:Tol biopolymer transport system component